MEPLDEFGEPLDDAAEADEATAGRSPGAGAAVRAELSVLARRVRTTLQPLEPPPDFVTDLRRYLAENTQRARQAAQREHEQSQRRLWWATGIGTVLYVAGLAGIAGRAILTLSMGIAVLLHLRQPKQPRTPVTN